MWILRLAWRNLWRHPRRTAIVLAAAAVGVSGAVLSMAVNSGIVHQMVETAIRTELGHLQIHAAKYEEDPSVRHRIPAGGRPVAEVLRADPEIRAVARRVRADGLLSSPRASAGVVVLGVVPDEEVGVSRLARSVVAGSWLDGARRRVLLGEALADRIHVRVGQKVVLAVQDLGGNLTGEAFRVAGLFRTPSSEFDRGTVLLGLDDARSLLALGDGITEVVAVVRHEERLPEVRRRLEGRLPPGLELRTWRELRPLLVQMLEVFDSTSWALYAAIFAAMVFGIANVLLMSVHERSRELGVLRSLGMAGAPMVAMVVGESLLLTGVGVAAGFAVAGGAVAGLSDGIDLTAFGAGLEALGVGTRVVPRIRRQDVVAPVLMALVTALLAGLGPAVRVARLRPVEALRRI